MRDKKKPKKISGWYIKSGAANEQRQQQEDDWYDSLRKLNYKTIPVETPGKMLSWPTL